MGTSVLPGALTTLQAMRPGLIYSYFAFDQTSFNAALALGGWDLVVFGEQGNSVYGSSSAGLSTHLAGGGKVLVSELRSV